MSCEKMGFPHEILSDSPRLEDEDDEAMAGLEFGDAKDYLSEDQIRAAGSTMEAVEQHGRHMICWLKCEERDEGYGLVMSNTSRRLAGGLLEQETAADSKFLKPTSGVTAMHVKVITSIEAKRTFSRLRCSKCHYDELKDHAKSQLLTSPDHASPDGSAGSKHKTQVQGITSFQLPLQLKRRILHAITLRRIFFTRGQLARRLAKPPLRKPWNDWTKPWVGGAS